MAAKNASLGEGNSLAYGAARQPVPFERKDLLYAMHTFFTFVSRMWDMGIVLLIAEITHNSLYFVALAGLLGSMSIFMFMSHVGEWLDHTDRLEAVRFALLCKVCAVSAAYFICGVIPEAEDKVVAYALPVLCAVAALSFKTITQSMEKDWIVVLADRDTEWLSGANSVMTQIDLFSATAAPAVTGVLFAAFPKGVTAMLLLLFNLAASVALWAFVRFVYRSYPVLGSKHAAYNKGLQKRTDQQFEDMQLTTFGLQIPGCNNEQPAQWSSNNTATTSPAAFNPLVSTPSSSPAPVGTSSSGSSSSSSAMAKSTPASTAMAAKAVIAATEEEESPATVGQWVKRTAASNGRHYWQNTVTHEKTYTNPLQPSSSQHTAVAIPSQQHQQQSTAALSKALGDFYSDDEEGGAVPAATTTAGGGGSSSGGTGTVTDTSDVYYNIEGGGARSRSASIISTTSHTDAKSAAESAPAPAGAASAAAAYIHPYLECVPGFAQTYSFCCKLKSGYSAFRVSGCAGTMLAYSLLYFTVLSFGPLMTVYLRWADMSDYWIGVSRGLNALFGFTGAVLFPHLKARWGIWVLAQRSIWYQCTLVAFAASSFFWGSQPQINICIVTGVLFSRIGLWIFDLCARQIAQEMIPEDLRGSTNGFWSSVTAFFDMATFVVAIFFPQASDFILLTSISALVILTAAITFTVSQPMLLHADYIQHNNSCIDYPARFLREMCITSGYKIVQSDGHGDFAQVSQDSKHGNEA